MVPPLFRFYLIIYIYIYICKDLFNLLCCVYFLTICNTKVYRSFKVLRKGGFFDT